MPKYHTSLTPVTLFILRTCLYFQMLDTPSYLTSALNWTCTKLNLIYYFQTKFCLVSSLSQESFRFYIFPRWKLWVSLGSWPLSHWLKFNYSTQLFTFFFRDISQVWLLLLSTLSRSCFKSVLIILSNYCSSLLLHPL